MSEKKREVAFMDYNLAEELISSISHGVGAGLGIAATVLVIVKAAHTHSGMTITACCLYGASLIFLYLMSCIYHALARNTAKKVFRVIDHCSVFLLISGTYTPYGLISLRGAAGWVLLGIIWGLTIIGIVFNAIDVDKYETVSAIINLLTGWSVLIVIKPLYAAIGTYGTVMLFAGGAAYTLGAILYALGDHIRYMHSVFHFFVLGGSICHFFSIYCSVIK